MLKILTERRARCSGLIRLKVDAGDSPYAVAFCETFEPCAELYP